MKAVVLAAGKGSRLYPITRHIAKPLLPLAGRPTLHYVFDRLKEIDATDVCLVVGENENEMHFALGDGDDVGVSLSYVVQHEPKGLAHALRCAEEFVGRQDFVMYLGDGIYGSSLKPFADRFHETGCNNLNLVKAVEDPSRFGVANTDGERIVKLVEKPKQPESNLAMQGVYFFDGVIWDVLPDLQPSARGEFEITDAIQMLIDRGGDVRAGVYEGAWFDTGTLDSFLETSAYLMKNGAQVGAGASVKGELGNAVSVGASAVVECRSIEDSVVFSGSRVRCSGDIRHSILCGDVQTDGDLIGVVAFGDERA
ncbi:MAG: sugar phosphate nucleotidyltransferase [Armatimonadota bacterium]|nr:sugar phosphate nucleotidyltransferase [Armatimonadota bacterium]